MKHAFFVTPGRYLAGLFLLLTGLSARAQAPAWQTAVVGSGNTSIIAATAADASGNVYVAGSFTRTLVLGNLTLTSAGGDDVFVAKWSTATSRFIWAQRAGGTQEDRATGVATSGANVYVAGYYSGLANFGSTTFNSPGGTDVFVAKFTDAGPSVSFAWAQRAGGTQDDRATGVAVSGTDVYVAGTFSGTLILRPFTLVSAGGVDGFVAKLIETGATPGGPSTDFTWAQRAGGPGADLALGVVARGANVYVAGTFSGTLGQVFLGLASAGGTDVFVAKLIDAGPSASFAWAQRAGGTQDDRATGVAVSGANVYVAGVFSGAADFGATALASAIGSDVFVTKLTDAGPSASFAWARRAGGLEDDRATGVAVSGANVYVAGVFSGAVDFGATALASAGASDVFVAKLTDAGSSASFAWAQRAGGTGTDLALGVAVNGSNVYVGGLVSPPASFGALTFASPAGSNSGFLASLLETVLATRSAGPLMGLTLAPNPARTAATVRLPAVPGAAEATLKLLDALGRAVHSQRVPLPAAGATLELPLAGLAPGLYRLQVQAGERQTSRALVVE